MQDLKTVFGQQISWNGVIVLKEWKYLGVIDVFTKYKCVKHLKGKKCKTVLNTFIEIVNESNHKLSKLWLDQER